MVRFLFLSCFAFYSYSAFTQTIYSSLQSAVSRLEADAQLKHGVLAFHVVDGETGKQVFSRNAEMGLAVASSQKVITAATAFELLGREFKYTTSMTVATSYPGDEINNSGLMIEGTGDPTFGSWRYKQTIDSVILNNWAGALKARGIEAINGAIWVLDHNSFGSYSSPIPQGYIWQDIGNYYGAGTSLINWHENQYDVTFQSSSTGALTKIKRVSPLPPGLKITNLVSAGQQGSGDNAYIYSSPYADKAFIHGTIPPNRESFTISGSIPDPGYAFGAALRQALIKNGIRVDSIINSSSRVGPVSYDRETSSRLKRNIHYSPPLDSIVYWFLKKSINLYGDALVKTLSMQANGKYEMENGLKVIRDYWAKRGIEKSALEIGDGSGLSPSNRVTASALVTVMRYARNQKWFDGFYEALPEYNGLKMKSGTIGGAKSFTGYVKSKSGKEYVFAIVVNNFSGSASQIVDKMYRILNILK